MVAHAVTGIEWTFDPGRRGKLEDTIFRQAPMARRQSNFQPDGLIRRQANCAQPKR